MEAFAILVAVILFVAFVATLAHLNRSPQLPKPQRSAFENQNSISGDCDSPPFRGEDGASGISDTGKLVEFEPVVRPSKAFEADDRDDDYEAFVEKMWNHVGVELGGLELSYRRYGGTDPLRLGRAIRVVRGDNQQVYVNMIDAEGRCTVNVMSGHDWRRNDAPIEPAAFGAILRGIDPAAALIEKDYPASPAEAVACDRFATSDRRFIIGYRGASGRVTYRVISRIVRRADRFSARCHLRWGDRRTFLNDKLVEVFEAASGEAIPTSALLSSIRTR